MAPTLTEFEISTLAEGGTLFVSALKHLHTLYPGAYSRGSTYKVIPLNIDYKGEMEIEVGMHCDILSLGWAPECREEDDPSPDWVHERK